MPCLGVFTYFLYHDLQIIILELKQIYALIMLPRALPQKLQCEFGFKISMVCNALPEIGSQTPQYLSRVKVHPFRCHHLLQHY